MCLTIPGKVEAVDKGIATVRNGREKLQIDLSLVFDVKPGDWILYATDRAVKRISEDDAREIIFLLESHYSPVDVSKLSLKFKKIIFKVRSGLGSNKELGSREKGKDFDTSPNLSLSRRGIDHDEESTTPNPSHSAVAQGRPSQRRGDLTLEEIEYLLNLKGKNNLETLYAEANFIRRDMIKDFICIHGIIEFSNYCKNDCLYCGINAKNSKCSRYRMTKEEIVDVAFKASKEGYKLIVLQSGEDDFYSDDDLLQIIIEIRSKMRMFIFLSVGERSLDFYKRAYEIGATGALMRFETSNEKLYSYLRPGKKLSDRLDLINNLRDLGYYVATGSMTCLPGQTVADMAKDLMVLQELDVPMVSAGPWLPASGTTLENIQYSDKEKMEMMLKYAAVARFLMPEAKIPVTTALETINPEAQYLSLRGGANSIMLNLTPDKFAEQYQIYDNKYRKKEAIWQKYGLFTDEESWEMLEEKMRIK